MPDVAAIIRERAAAHGVDPATLLRIGQVESGLDPASRTRTSSATGLFQILTKGPKSEWAQYGGGADPTDPYANADAGARIIADKTAALRAAGIAPSPANVYLAHFAGTAGATKLLAADPGAPVSSVLSPEAVTANPFLAGMSVGDMRAWAGRKMGAPTGAPAGSNSQAGPMVASAAAPATLPSGAPGPGGAAPGGPASAAAPGLLNAAAAPADPSADPNFQSLLASAQAAMAPTPAPAPLSPIQFPIPAGLPRARLLAAMQMPVGG